MWKVGRKLFFYGHGRLYFSTFYLYTKNESFKKYINLQIGFILYDFSTNLFIFSIFFVIKWSFKKNLNLFIMLRN